MAISDACTCLPRTDVTSPADSTRADGRRSPGVQLHGGRGCADAVDRGPLIGPRLWQRQYPSGYPITTRAFTSVRDRVCPGSTVGESSDRVGWLGRSGV